MPAWNLEVIGTYAQTEMGHGTVHSVYVLGWAGAASLAPMACPPRASDGMYTLFTCDLSIEDRLFNIQALAKTLLWSVKVKSYTITEIC